MKCNVCGFEENQQEKFVGIFVLGESFYTTKEGVCCLYGCPKCGTVKFTTNNDYINQRKQEWKNKGKSKKRQSLMIQELNKLYPDTNFDFHEEEDSLQLLYNNEKYKDDDDFFDTVSDIALKYLTSDEQEIFAILYDYFDEISK